MQTMDRSLVDFSVVEGYITKTVAESPGLVSNMFRTAALVE